MTKKRQTTSGLPKTAPAKKPTESPDPSKSSNPSLVDRLLRRGQGTREYHSRAEREAEIQRTVIIGTIVSAAIIALVLVIAVIVEGFIRPNQLAAAVNGQNISIGDFQKRVRLERAFLIERVNNTVNNRMALTGETDPNNTFAQMIQENPTFSRWWDELRFTDQMGLRVLDDMIDDNFIQAEAENRGITVDDAAIDEQINEFIGYDPEQIANIGVEPTATSEPTTTPTPFVSPTPSPTPTETPTLTPTATSEATGEATATVESTATTEATAFPTFTPGPTSTPAPTLSREEVEKNFTDFRQEFLNNIRNKAGISDSDVRNYFRALALRKALGEALVGDTENAQYVDLRQILVSTEEEAQDVLNALSAGESFADLARAVSKDEAAQSGGEIGERGLFELQKPIVDAIRDAAIGETLGPIEIEDGFVIVQLRSRETRELDEFDRDTVIGRAITEWLEEQRASEQNKFETFDSWTANVPDSPAFIYEP